MQCFLGQVGDGADGTVTNFLMANGTIVGAESLKKQDLLKGPYGIVTVLSVREHPRVENRIVYDMVTKEFTITATSDHRVMVQAEYGFEPRELGRLSSGMVRASNGLILPFTVTSRSVRAALFEIAFSEDLSVYVRMSSPSLIFGEARGCSSVPYDPAVYTMFRFKGPICEVLKSSGVRQWCVDNDCNIEALQIQFWEGCPYAVWVHRNTSDIFYDHVRGKLQTEGGGVPRRSKVYRVKEWQHDQHLQADTNVESLPLLLLETSEDFSRMPASPEPLTP